MGETNRLMYGDNLNVLRERIAAEGVDLISLDPVIQCEHHWQYPVEVQDWRRLKRGH